MLRTAGIIALILSSILSLLVFSRIRSVSASGRFSSKSGPEIYLETANRTKNVFDRGTAPAYPGTFGLGANGNIFINIEVPFPNLPEWCEVEIKHRWISLGGTVLTSTVVWHEGNSYPIERSPEIFLGQLALIALAPIILWGLSAIASFLFVSASPSQANEMNN